MGHSHRFGLDRRVRVVSLANVTESGKSPGAFLPDSGESNDFLLTRDGLAKGLADLEWNLCAVVGSNR